MSNFITPKMVIVTIVDMMKCTPLKKEKKNKKQ